MFTGLVADIGTVGQMLKRGQDMQLGINTAFAIGSIRPGDSVAVNGVCLTAEEIKVVGHNLSFVAYVSGETLANSNLGSLKQGNKVNLELALALGERMGGHIVSGHADGLAVIDKLEQLGSSYRIRFDCAPELDIYIVNKGSICVDGISLTVNKCGPGYFELNIIPKTWNSTTATLWKKGYQVNLEVDLLGKYVAKMLRLDIDKVRDSPSKGKALDLDFFIKNGFN